MAKPAGQKPEVVAAFTHKKYHAVTDKQFFVGAFNMGLIIAVVNDNDDNDDNIFTNQLILAELYKKSLPEGMRKSITKALNLFYWHSITGRPQCGREGAQMLIEPEEDQEEAGLEDAQDAQYYCV